MVVHVTAASTPRPLPLTLSLTALMEASWGLVGPSLEPPPPPIIKINCYVLFPVPGMIGTLQALEVMKIAAKIGGKPL